MQADAERAAGVVVEPEVVQRLARVVVGLAAGDQAEAVVRPFDDVVVEPVGAHVGERGVPLVVHQPRFLLERAVGPADVQAAGRHREVLGQHDRDAVRVDSRSWRRLDDLLDRLHADQTPAKRLSAKACRPMSRMSCTEAGKNTGRPQALKMWSLWCAAVELLAMWSSPATAITPPCFEVPAMLACLNTSEQRSTPGPLPYQMPNTPSNFFDSRIEVELLRAPDGGRRQLLVDARLEHDVLRRQVLLRLPQRLVVAAERRAAVAADEAGGVQAGQRVALSLQHRQPHQRLHAAHEGAAGFERVLVVERDGSSALRMASGSGAFMRQAPVFEKGRVSPRGRGRRAYDEWGSAQCRTGGATDGFVVCPVRRSVGNNLARFT